jgi:hypothetical protein
MPCTVSGCVYAEVSKDGASRGRTWALTGEPADVAGMALVLGAVAMAEKGVLLCCFAVLRTETQSLGGGCSEARVLPVAWPWVVTMHSPDQIVV